MEFRFKLVFFLAVYFNVNSFAQQLVINEVSQGPSGSKEYVELVVVGTPTCNSIPCMDLRNYYIDDNNGTHATGAGVGIAPGCIRLKNIPFWQCIPYGTIIVFYNDADLNASIPPQDLSMTDNNCRLIIPISDCTLLERHTTGPNTSSSTYPTTGFTNCGNWTPISMANGDDSFQTITPTGGLHHSVSWGNNNLSPIIYFAGSAAGKVCLMTNSSNNNPANQANWIMANVGGNESPGSPNNPANSAWISSMNNSCLPLLPFTGTVSSTNAGCTCNGSATMVAAGAIGPYTYTWFPSGGNSSIASGLCSGIYTVSSTSSNGCIQSLTVNITSVGSVSASIINTSISCNGFSNGSATVTPSGGSGPYTYTWSPTGGNTTTASGLGVGTYTVLVKDANNCTVTAITTINQPAVLTAAISSSNVSCNGGSNGSATVIAGGGNPGYTYNWVPSGGTSSVATGFSIGNYTATITDSKGCTVTAVANITQPAALTAVISSSNTSCGSANGSATVTAGGGNPGYTYNWTPSGGTSSVATGFTAGSYTATITDSKGCTVTAVANITQPSAPTAIISTSNVGCNGGTNGSATVTASGGNPGYTYNWTPSGGTSSVATGFSAGSYTATITDSQGCTVTAVANITQPSALAAAISLSNVSCNGQSNGSATVTAGGGTPGYTYNWAPSGGTSSVATGFAAGNYSVIITDTKGCTVTAVANIAEPSVLNAVISASNVSCNGDANGSATVTAGGGNSGYVYNWTPSGGTASVASGFAPGSYTATITDSKGCTVTAVTNISEPPVLTAAISSSNTSCGSSNGSATVTAGGGNSGYTYNWAPSGGTSSVATGFAAGSYTVTITDNKGCTVTAVATIIQPGAPTAIISSGSLSCNGGTNGSATVTAIGGNPGYSYNWMPSGGTSSVATGFSAGSYTATITDSQGCTVTAVANIIQPSAITAAMSLSNISCNGQSNGSATVIAGGGNPGYTYNWAPSGGTSSVATGFAVGIYTATITDSRGCAITALANITQPPVLTAAISSSNVSCNGGSNGSATVTAGGGNPGYTYNWAPSGGTASVATGFSVGNYTVTITDSKGCAITEVTNISYVGSNLSLSVSPTKTICEGVSSVLTASASGGNGAYQYSWMPGNITTPDISVTLSNTTVFTVSVNDGCTTQNAVETITVYVEVLGTSTVIANNYEGCMPLCVSFTNASTLNNSNIQSSSWSFSDGSNSTDILPTHCFTKSGQYTAYHTFTTKLGCVGTGTINKIITVHPKPYADFTSDNDKVIIYNSEIKLTNQSTNAANYLWDFAGQSQSTLENASYSFNEVGKYLVTLVAFNGPCSDTAFKIIECLPEFTFYAPNCFTPDDDKLNERFLPVGEGWDTDSYSLQIFDRWGEKIFTSKQWNEGWNGKHKEDIVKNDVYVWRVTLKDVFNKSHEFVGHITVLK